MLDSATFSGTHYYCRLYPRHTAPLRAAVSLWLGFGAAQCGVATAEAASSAAVLCSATRLLRKNTLLQGSVAAMESPFNEVSLSLSSDVATESP